MRSILILILCLLTACTPEPPMRIGTNVWPGYEPLYVARERGMLPPEDFRLVELGSASQVMRALQNGELDAGTLTLDEASRLAAQGTQIAIALVLDVSHGADAVVSRSPIRSADDLRGKRIILEVGSVGELMLDALLSQYDLGRKDVQLVYRTLNDHRQAFLAQEGDLLISFEPHISQLMRETGAYRVFDSRQIPDAIVDVLVIRQDRLADCREKLARLTHAWFDTLQFYESDPDQALELANRRLRAAPEDLKDMYRGLKLGTPDVQQNFARRWPFALQAAGELARLRESAAL